MSRMTVVSVSATLTCATVLAAWSAVRAPRLEATVPVEDPRLNVLVIVWDTVRADRLSPYGAERPTTPWLAEASRDAVVFEQAHSPGIWTLPAHASMFTGLPPESTGADERWIWLDGHHTTLAEHFADQGFGTFAMAANPLLCDQTNLLQGFRVQWQTYDPRHRGQARALTQAKLIEGDRSQELAPDWEAPSHGATNAEWARARFKDAAPLVGEKFLSWVDHRKDPDAPFLAYLNLMEAHTPRLPSAEARKSVINDDRIERRALRTDASHIRLHFYNFRKQRYSKRDLEAINAVYDATLRDLDDATQAVFAGLEERGLLQSTVIVLTSDHGENLGEHHLFNHRFALWQTLTHVPLIVWHPQLGPARRPAPVSTRDLFGTLARLAHVDVPDGLGDWWTAPSPAVSWLAKPLRREIETVKKVHSSVEVEPWIRSGHALVRGTDKVMALSDGTIEVYDLAEDPKEEDPVDDASLQDALLADLKAYQATVPAYDPSLRGPEDQPMVVRASQDELREHLTALGYVVEDPSESTSSEDGTDGSIE
ncbi:MAG: sulfatase-like hydrolase/transferase [Myxococcota bacterium]